MHWHVGQPFGSSTLPYWQKIAHTGPQVVGSGTQAQALASQRVPGAHITVWAQVVGHWTIVHPQVASAWRVQLGPATVTPSGQMKLID